MRARLLLSRVMVSEAQFKESEETAAAAVNDAIQNGFDTVAADGLTELASALQFQGKVAAAEAHLRHAIQLAEQRGARRTAARARLQFASLLESAPDPNPTEALTLIESVLPFLKANGYRALETYARQIASRSHQALDELEKAREMSSAVLALAEGVRDEPSIALASTNLASVLATLGDYPEALRLRLRAEAIHRKQGDERSLAYDLANRADLLIRLGRSDEAAVALAEIDAARAAGKASYESRARHVVFYRALSAATHLRCDEALRHLSTVEWSEAPGTVGVLGPAVAALCAARTGRKAVAIDEGAGVDPAAARERAYWLAAAAQDRGDGRTALEAADRGLARLGSLPFDELRWRLAAVAAAACSRVGDSIRGAEMAGIARTSLEKLKLAWKSDFERYERRPDLVYLIRKAGLQ
jgi:tetratricopeptide (TPR) repeat protein